MIREVASSLLADVPFRFLQMREIDFKKCEWRDRSAVSISRSKLVAQSFTAIRMEV